MEAPDLMAPVLPVVIVHLVIGQSAVIKLSSSPLNLVKKGTTGKTARIVPSGPIMTSSQEIVKLELDLMATDLLPEAVVEWDEAWVEACVVAVEAMTTVASVNSTGSLAVTERG